jgi:hypothetical protein
MTRSTTTAPRQIGTARRWLVLLAVATASVAASTAAARAATQSFTTTITSETIGKSSASFRYGETGAPKHWVLGFVCKLADNGLQPKRWSSCTAEPKTYHSLTAGNYTFMVQGVSGSGAHSNIASYAFTIA